MSANCTSTLFDRYDKLEMTPEDWSLLNMTTSAEQYRKLENEYQIRKNEKKMKCCNSMACYYYTNGMCANPVYCKRQVPA